MSLIDNKLLIRRFIEEAVKTEAVGRIQEFIATDYRDQNDPPGRFAGIEGCREHIIGVLTTCPDQHLTIEDQIAQGDLFATRITMTGTHRSEWPPEVKPANKAVRIAAVNIDRVRDSCIVEHGGAANELTAFIQSGVFRFEDRVD